MIDLLPMVELLDGRRWIALTGAGISTDSGIPDYRGPHSPRATPMMYEEFTGSLEARQRYWARSIRGWAAFGQARPNPGHEALVELESSNLAGVITQNVDGLHLAAGSSPVLELHGSIARVVCLDCRRTTDRGDLQQRLLAANPDLHGELAPGQNELNGTTVQLRPDGDAVVDHWSDFIVVPCLACGGTLKPDVVFFGESVPRPVAGEADCWVEGAEALVVLGSKLTVMSGLRLARAVARRGIPLVVVNRGATRADDIADLRYDAGCTELLGSLVRTLARAA